MKEFLDLMSHKWGVGKNRPSSQCAQECLDGDIDPDYGLEYPESSPEGGMEK